MQPSPRPARLPRRGLVDLYTQLHLSPIMYVTAHSCIIGLRQSMSISVHRRPWSSIDVSIGVHRSPLTSCSTIHVHFRQLASPCVESTYVGKPLDSSSASISVVFLFHVFLTCILPPSLRCIYTNVPPVPSRFLSPTRSMSLVFR